jgi:hypothetical protein
MASYYNPGAIGRLIGSDIQFSHAAWYAGISLNYAQLALRVGSVGTVLATVTQLSSGDIDVRSVEQPLGTGERYSVSDLAAGLGYGLMITDRFSCGIVANYIEERIWHSSVSMFGINVGTLYELSSDGLRIGASLSNFGSRSRFQGSDLRVRYDLDPSRYGDNSSIPSDLSTDDYGLPIVFRVGLSYPLTIANANVVTIAVDALHPSDNSESLNFGAEWVFKDVLALRIGYQSLFQLDSEVGLTLGGGLKWDALGYDLRVDYAWASHDRLGNVQRIALGLAF